MTAKYSDIWKMEGLTRCQKEKLVQLSRFTLAKASKPKQYKGSPSQQPFQTKS